MCAGQPGLVAAAAALVGGEASGSAHASAGTTAAAKAMLTTAAAISGAAGACLFHLHCDACLQSACVFRGQKCSPFVLVTATSRLNL